MLCRRRRGRRGPSQCPVVSSPSRRLLPGQASEVAPETEILAPGGRPRASHLLALPPQIRRPTVPQPYSTRDSPWAVPCVQLRLPPDPARAGSRGPPGVQVCAAAEGFRSLEEVGVCATGMSGGSHPGLQAPERGWGDRGWADWILSVQRDREGECRDTYGRVSNCASLFRPPPAQSPWPRPVLDR